MADTVRLRFQGDASDLTKAFDDAGQGAKDMAADIDRATSDTKSSFGGLGEGIDASQGKFRGFSDSIQGTGDVMEGFRSGNLALMATGFADIAGGITDFAIPAMKAMRSALLTGLAPAFTAIAAHPLIAAILIGGAIIAGLILLEKKFGLVSGTVRALGDILSAVWDFIRPILKKMAQALDDLLGPLDEVLGGAAKLGIGAVKGIGGAIGGIFHTGGIVPGASGTNVPMILQAGETVVPRGKTMGGGGVTINVAGSVITERDLGRVIADQLRNNRLIGVT